MIVIRLEHWKDGDSKRKTVLGSAQITNTNTGDEEVGHYAVELFGPARNDGTQRKIADGLFHAPRKGGQISAFRVAARGILAALGERL